MSAETGSAHPTPDQLDAWLEENLLPDELRELEAHFESCAECRELAADLRGFAELEDPSFTAADEEKILGRVRHRILAEEAARLPFVSRPTPSPVRLHPAGSERRFFVPAWAAAALVLLASGIAVQRQLEVGRLEQENARQGAEVAELEARLREPFANPIFLEARSADDRQRSEAPPPPAGAAVLVSVEAMEPLPLGTWRAVIEKAGGDEVLTVPELVPSAGRLQFLLLPGALEKGDYQVRLFRGEEPWPQVFELNL